MPDTDPRALEALYLAKRVRGTLCDHDHAVQGSVLAQLLAHWLVDHPPAIEDVLIEAHIRAVRGMAKTLREESEDA